MMRTEGSLRRKIWKPFDWILLWLEKILANLNREVAEGIRQKEKKGDD